MAKNVNLIQYLPDILQEIKEFGGIAAAENPELTALWSRLEDVSNDQFVQFATENGVKRWESILKIFPKGTDSLEDRRFRILTRLNEQLPYSYRMLEQQLATLCGEDGYRLQLNREAYELIIRVALSAKSNYADVESMLKRTVPANMVIDLSLIYNQYSALERATYGRLSAYTYNQLRNEVII